MSEKGCSSHATIILHSTYMWLSLIDACEQYPLSGITARKRQKYASDLILITNSLYTFRDKY